MKRGLLISVAAGALVAVAVPAQAATWTSVQIKAVGSQSGVQAVDLLSGTDGWAVGFQGSAGGLVQRWNGTRFSVVPSPNFVDATVTSAGAGLTGVDALSSTDSFAVGTFRFFGSDGLSHSTAVAERWNGASWTRTTVPNPNPQTNAFNDVKAFSANDAWAVGRAGDSISGVTLAMHWNGTAWSRVSTPSPGSRDSFLLAVSGTASTDVWAVGYYFDLPYGNRVRHSLALHWNGSSWTRVTTPDVG